MGNVVPKVPNASYPHRVGTISDKLASMRWSGYHPSTTFQMTTTMDTTYDDIVQGVRDFGYVGLKCYHFYSKNVEHTFDSDIMQYVTHEQCRAANELGLSLSIHMVKRHPRGSKTLNPRPGSKRSTYYVYGDSLWSPPGSGSGPEGRAQVKRRALSDPSNLETIRMLCETYPFMKVILCHSARGFNMCRTLLGHEHRP